MTGKVPHVGPFSGTDRLTNADGRTRVARLMKGIHAALVEHVGGQPNAAQQILIHQATIKLTRLVQLDHHIVSEDGLAVDQHQYLAWSNSMRRDLESLGIESPRQQLPSLGTYLEGKTE